MNERTLFVNALEKTDRTQRQAYLDEACGGDATLRERVEALLQSHEREGKFLDVPALEQLVPSGVTQAETSTTDTESPSLGFLTPSETPGSLGRLGHYEIQEIIGHGGMGIVLRAFDGKLHRMVAIKVMAAQLATNATARRRFSREAQAAAAVSHDHIVTIHAVEESAALPYLVMQYVAGLSLQQRLDRDGPLDLHEILRIGMQMASGLAAAHAQGLIHRDIKPANVLLENGVERVKITDFGLARAMTDASLTQSGVVAGTPQYMAPEQAEGKAVDQRTDLFSLGSVMYAMCTGRAPFRASGTMAVLKRVCEEKPTPIRDTNADIPAWLVAIIDKLHAKDPAQRFHSAAEVAELLGRHLAHVQHPSVAPLPLAETTRRGGKETGTHIDILRSSVSPGFHVSLMSRRRLAIAVSVVLCLLVGLSLTEATGVTNLRATVIRIVTPDGTLVVQVDDPAVKVTIEGDGGLVITGAGLEEIRLRPGSYKVHADREGKKILLDREVVSIAKNGREVVKVKLEATGQSIAKAEQGAFVLLAAGTQRKFETLADAVQSASAGDTIEVRGNGPFVSKPISISKTALTIRAGTGFRPVIKPSSERTEKAPLLMTNAALVLEGLDFQAGFPNEHNIQSKNAPLRAANCRFDGTIWMTQSPVCEFRNCQFLIKHGVYSCCAQQISSGARILFENCLYRCSGHALHLFYANDGTDDVSVQVTRSTFATNTAPLALSLQCPKPAGMDGPKALKPIRLDVSRSVFDTPGILGFGQQQGFTDKAGVLPPADADAMLLRLLEWRGEWNLFPAGSNSVHWYTNFKAQPPRGPKGLDEWKKFSGSTEADSRDGRPRFHGGNLLDRVELDQLAPEDFRLRPDSAGYRAGKDGKDLGADVDLVGPGPAYERWKKAPEYQQWLKDTKQVTTAAKPEPKAFVVLTGKGVEVRKFDTLADAVQGASDGDTIEIRGNGPFVIEQIEINRGLTIRAGAGFRPVITDTPQTTMPPGILGLLVAHGPLRLEGLELHCTSREGPILHAWGPVWAANCGFLSQGRGVRTCISCAKSCFVRNCQVCSPSGCAFGMWCDTDGSYDVSNCLLVGHNNINDSDVARGPTVRFTRNTFVTAHAATAIYHLMNMPRIQASKPPSARIRVFASENVLDCPWNMYTLLEPEEFKPKLTVAEAEAWLPQRVEWQDERNVYGPGKSFLGMTGHKPFGHCEELADWNRFWGLKDTGSSRAIIRFHGGDLHTKAKTDAGSLTPEDFRLRPDSPGYRAGKDGKDLGADVDLVGPGAAYERWKKTPEYQQWLKETKQTRAEAPKPEPKAFVVLTGKGAEVRKFDTLADAVQGASAGDTIEIRGNGPFVSKPILIESRSLNIRAGEGFRPVVKLDSDEPGNYFIRSNAPLVLEGLDLQWMDAIPAKTGRLSVLIDTWGPRAKLHAANCRFLMNQRDGVYDRLTCVAAWNTPVCQLRNCQSLIAGHGRVAGLAVVGNSPFIVDNCLIHGPGLQIDLADAKPIKVTLRHNTIVSMMPVQIALMGKIDLPLGEGNSPPIEIETSANILASPVVVFKQTRGFLEKAKPLSAIEAKQLLKKVAAWRGRENLFLTSDSPLVRLAADGTHLNTLPAKTLDDWKVLWGMAELDSQLGQAKFQGGDLVAKAALTPESLAPDDFRLRPDSAGKRAGKDGKDLGADVELVGPGPAYERWKKTPEYQQWLKETGQK